MVDTEPYARLSGLTRQLGGERRTLSIGEWRIRFTGLDRTLAHGLDRRWGGFVAPRSRGATIHVRVLDGGPTTWLGPPRAAEPYRLEACGTVERRVVASYHFALAASGAREWRLGLSHAADEPAERMLDNAARYLVARLALDAGGFALHAAGVLAHGRAFVFAGPSRAGKTTAVRRSAPGRSLGDDFAVVVPRRGCWCAAAVPFDNTERIADEPPPGLYPIAGIWRLHTARRLRTEQPSAAVAHASLLAAAAFPWALPEHTAALLEHVRRFLAEGHFAHLHFAPHSDLWSDLISKHDA